MFTLVIDSQISNFRVAQQHTRGVERIAGILVDLHISIGIQMNMFKEIFKVGKIISNGKDLGAKTGARTTDLLPTFCLPSGRSTDCATPSPNLKLTIPPKRAFIRRNYDYTL